jgi:hypothetical protein
VSVPPETISIVVPTGHRTRLAAAAFVLASALLLPGARAGAAAVSATVPALAQPPASDALAPVSAWPADPQLPLAWDVVHARVADEPTDVRVASDGRYLYVRFEATQREPAVATQHSNDTIAGGSQGNNGALSWSADDAVWVDLWPTGPTGFEYQFEANPNGSHNESSSENAAFAPQWESHGAVHGGGYTVTMSIPLNVIHGAHTGAWRAQFIRYVRATGSEFVWSFDAAQTNPDDASRAGTLAVTVAGKAPLPKPRAAVYGLGSVASAPAGGPTSRVGADISVPVTPTAAIFATFHPDFSNVELDQQSISPTVYQRQFSEVRPFFTQAASYYNNFNCDVCTGYSATLYTPAIPTFAQGYAFEGKQGNFGFAGFDAIGGARSDLASALDYNSPDTRWQSSFQHVTTSLPGLIDNTNELGWSWNDHNHLSAYAHYSSEAGTLVSDPSQATAIDGGGGYQSPRFALYAGLRSVGAQFNPVDGFVAHPGIAGYALYSARIWTFAPQSALASMGVSGVVVRYQGAQFGQSQSDNQLLFDVLTKSAWDLQLYSGSDYWRFGSALEPISQNGGFNLTYHSGLQTNNSGNFPSHGTSATPTNIQYMTGRYGAGRLDTWLRTSTVRAGDKGTVTFTADNTSQWLPNGPDNIQWFDGIAYSYQINRESSFAVGLRHVTGLPPQPNGGGNCAGSCSNVSVAYHLRLKNEELYIAYGNPSTLTTVPQALLKLIFYVGGQKGT